MNIGIDIDDTINNLADIMIISAKKYNEEQKIDYEIRADKWAWDEACRMG